MVIGKRIKQKRIEFGFTQEYLASLLFIDRSTISKWERGSLDPKIEQLQQLSEVFNVDIEYWIKSDYSSANPKISKYLSKDYYIILLLLLFAIILSPWGIVLSLCAFGLCIHNRTEVIVIILTVIVNLYCLDQLLFVFGSYLIPPIITID